MKQYLDYCQELLYDDSYYDYDPDDYDYEDYDSKFNGLDQDSFGLSDKLDIRNWRNRDFSKCVIRLHKGSYLKGKSSYVTKDKTKFGSNYRFLSIISIGDCCWNIAR